MRSKCLFPVLVALLVACVFSFAGPASASENDIYVDIHNQVFGEPGDELVKDIEPCHWYWLDPSVTYEGIPLTWKVHVWPTAIWDLHLSTWDVGFLVPTARTLELLPYSRSSCTFDIAGGPPVPGAPSQPYYQRLDLWGKTIPTSRTLTITMSRLPSPHPEKGFYLHPTTPEPGTLGLLACGVAGLLPMLRRRRRLS